MSLQVEILAKYPGDIEHQQREIEECQQQERTFILRDVDDDPISSLWDGCKPICSARTG